MVQFFLLTWHSIDFLFDQSLLMSMCGKRVGRDTLFTAMRRGKFTFLWLGVRWDNSKICIKYIIHLQENQVYNSEDSNVRSLAVEINCITG